MGISFMKYLNFVLLAPVFWVLLSFLSMGVWSQHRKHVYLLWLAGAWCCAGLAHTSVWLMPAASWDAQLLVAAAAWLGAVALAQAMAMRFGRTIHLPWLGAIAALITLGWSISPAALHLQQVLLVGVALTLGHVLPVIWHLALRHHLERALLASYSVVCVLILLSAGLSGRAEGWWIGRTWVLPLCAVVLTFAMLACAWAESSTHWYVARDRDGLTGLLSRPAFEKANHPRPAEQHISFIVLCDIDHFQRVKKKFGATVGNEVLKHFAQLLQSSVRTGDLAARLGNDEFGMALRDIDAAHAHALVQRILAAMAQQPWAQQLDIGPLTASFGLVQVAEDESLDMALHRADVLLCQAKDAGGSRVAAQEPLVPAHLQFCSG